MMHLASLVTTLDVSIKPVVDVLIPCAGDAGFFAETLRAVLAQTHREFRVIVCDNASEHGKYAQVVTEMASSKVLYRHFSTRLPMTENWQRCLDQVEANIFCFVHDDDLWASDYLELCVRQLVSGNLVFVMARHHVFGHSVSLAEPIDAAEMAYWNDLAALPWPGLRLSLYCAPLSHLSSIVFRRCAVRFQALKHWNPDQCFVRDYAKMGEGRINTDTWTRIRQYGNSVSSTFSRGRASRETIILLRENLLTLIREGMEIEDLLCAYGHLITPGGVFRIVQAAFSWPLESELFHLGRRLLRRPIIRRQVREYSMASRVLAALPAPVWVGASLSADFAYGKAMRKHKRS